ncbi:hypothetical protein PQI23_03605 [Leucobacter sp. USCH14]|uniref:hypothetical protein n=1 Tax=Leucobacter sp. USCH14 TaxID=3024838 RepID=UPI0030B6C2EF
MVTTAALGQAAPVAVAGSAPASEPAHSPGGASASAQRSLESWWWIGATFIAVVAVAIGWPVLATL